MSKKHQSYFKVVADEKGNEADLYLYGIIGQDYWWDEDLNEESLTDLAVARKIAELEKSYERINIRINSPGGMVYHGMAIISAVQRCKCEVHTYVDGLAASMAADIWAAAPNRHMSIASKLMIHSVSSVAIGTAKAMREEAERLDKFDEIAIATFAANTGMSEEEVKERFYDYNDHWLSAKDAKEIGLIHAIEAYDQEDMPSDVEKMSYRELLKHFEEDQNEEGLSLMARLKQHFAGFLRSEKAASIDNQTKQEMKLNEFQESLGTDLAVEDVVKALQERGYTVEEPQPTPETAPVDVAKQIEEGINAALQPLQETVKALQEEVKHLGDQPGAKPTEIAAGADAKSGVTTAGTGPQDAIAKLAQAAEEGARVETSY